MQENTVPKSDSSKKPQPPSTEKEQGISQPERREEKTRESNVIPFPEKREGKKGTNRGNK